MKSTLISILAGSVFLLAAGTSARADVLRVPADHATIQAAVDAAAPGDLILIASGTYSPFTVTTDDLTIREADENSDPVILIPGLASGSGLFGVAVTITADRVTVEGLTADGLTDAAVYSVGFRVTGDDNELRGNHAIPMVGNPFAQGIGFDSLSCNRTVFDGNRVTAFFGASGFKAVDCSDEVYLNNEANDAQIGFEQTGCANQTYKQNSAFRCSAGFQCISAVGATYRENLAADGGFGPGFGLFESIHVSLRENTARDGFAGFWLTTSNDNELRGNLATGSQPGSGFILDQGSDFNDLRDNLSTGNAGFGYRVTELLDNSFLDNEAYDNAMGGASQPGIVD